MQSRLVGDFREDIESRSRRGTVNNSVLDEGYMPPWIIGTRKFVHEMNPDRCRTQSKLADESQLLEVYGFDQRDRTFTFFDSRVVDSTISATISNFMSINSNGTKNIPGHGPGTLLLFLSYVFVIRTIVRKQREPCARPISQKRRGTTANFQISIFDFSFTFRLEIA
jgi:hypothetical protein